MKSFLHKFLFFSFVFFSGILSAQDDTLSPKLFTDQDLVDLKAANDKIVTSANLLAENYEDLPQEVYVVSGDDIRKFGYTTLVDVLKNVPGFRTSQPGNALEGETFLMRGLNGNDHAKILINGVPIKPEAVKGMPIASQLPIRHAERIEIVMGPSAAAYGADAMAGVINIVLPEVERPVFAWADINLMNDGGNEFNLTLGGKIGRGKNILNYQMFATSYSARDQNIYIPPDSIRLAPGALSPNQMQLLITEPLDPTLPEIDFVPKISRLVGGSLNFRWFELSAMSMYREDHSALGTFPTNSSYHDPDFTTGENINLFAIKYATQKDKRFKSRASLSSITYRMLTGSSYYGVDHFLSNGKNFMYARSFDLRAEYQGILKINKQSNLVVGAVGQFSISHPFTNYLAQPFKYRDPSYVLPSILSSLATGAVSNPTIDSLSLLDSTTYVPTYATGILATFVQYSYFSKSKKLNIVAGTRIDYIAAGDVLVFTPKLGVMYRPWENLKIRAFYGTGYRAPRSYHLYNSYTASISDINAGGGLNRTTSALNLNSEELDGAELGVLWKITDQWSIDGSFFLHRMENRMVRQILRPLPPGQQSPNDTVGVTFFNGDAYSQLNSFMFSVGYKKQFTKLKLDFLASYQYAIGYEILEQEDNNPSTNIISPGYRFMPENTFKFNASAEFYGFTVALNYQLFGNYITEVFRDNANVVYGVQPYYFNNFDVSVHKVLFRQLSVFGKVGNLFDSVQSGISNINLSNTWTYNPQMGRTFRVGLTFKLN